MNLVKTILNQARWTPSGDNAQPWRFQIIDESNFYIHLKDTRDWCAFDLNGFETGLGAGALLESLDLAAKSQGAIFSYKIVEQQNLNQNTLTPYLIEAKVTSHTSVNESNLSSYLDKRYVNRFSYRLGKPIKKEDKEILFLSMYPYAQLRLLENFWERFKVTSLVMKSSNFRLRMKEFYQTHQKIIQWNSSFIEDRIPDQALGLSFLSLKVMKWAMASWERVDFLNQYLAGTLLPKIELDLLPGIFCSAHFVIYYHKPIENVFEVIESGRQLQRFWLTATSLGLSLQPAMVLPIFIRYLKQGILFKGRETEEMKLLAKNFESFLGDACSVIFMGRLGYGKYLKSRSLRKSLDQLIIST